MNYLDNNTEPNDKIVIIKNLLKKQIVNDEKKKMLSLILNYLECQEANNKDDIYLTQEIELLYDCIL